MVQKAGKIVHLAEVRATNLEAARRSVLEAIHLEHGLALRRFLNVRLHQEEDREDVIQDIFVRLAALPDVETYFIERPQSVRNYLFAVAANMLKDRARRARVRQANAHQVYEDADMVVPSVSPEQHLSVKQDIGRMQEVLMKLKPHHRYAFVLSRFKYMSNKDVAKTIGVSVSTVEKYISKAMVALRKELK